MSTREADVLSTSEERSLADLETIIERGLATFVAVGTALLDIRRDRLYRETHETFEAYCRERWGFSRIQAHRLIAASEVITALPIGNTILPQNEAQARELARIPASERAEVWQAVSAEHGTSVTAADIRRFAQERAARTSDAPSLAVNPAPISGDIFEAAYQLSDAAGKADLNRLRYRAKLFKDIKAAGMLLSYDPKDIANALTLDEIDAHLSGFFDLLKGWSEECKANVPRGLHIVKGQSA